VHRRAFIGGLTGSLLATPLAAEAQQAGKVAQIAILGSTRAEDLPQSEGLRQDCASMAMSRDRTSPLSTAGRKADSSGSTTSRRGWQHSSLP
jgi:hypothetical protein